MLSTLSARNFSIFIIYVLSYQYDNFNISAISESAFDALSLQKKMCLSCSTSLLLLFVHLLSCVRLCATPWTAARQVSLSFTISQSMLKLMSIESVMLSNHLILCHPLLLPPSIFPSIRVFLTSQLFTSGGRRIGTSASASVLPMNTQDWSSCRMDWLDLLAVQGTLKNLLQHYSSKASILWHSGFFVVQLSHPYMTSGKTIALTIQTFVSKWCLCFLICCLALS